MRARHLTTRFFGALSPAAPSADDVEWVEKILTPETFEMWQRQPNHDRRHAIAVARGVQSELAGTPYASSVSSISCV